MLCPVLALGCLDLGWKEWPQSWFPGAAPPAYDAELEHNRAKLLSVPVLNLLGCVS